MATTNINTDASDSVLSTDIYEISDFIDQVRRNNISDVSDTASIVGIFGYMNEIFSQSLQNTLVVVSETSNETIPTRAKFSKNIIAHALNYGITKLMSQPAVMTLMIYLPLNYLELNFTEQDATSGTAKFIFDKDVPINVDEFEFHLDYDVIINRIKNPNTGKYTYTAMYDLFQPGTTIVKRQNPISDITNPYITTLVQQTINGIDYLAFSARLHQVSTIQIEKNILTDNDIENKTLTFTFEDQLAAFDVEAEENGKIIHMTPIYSGLLDNTVTDYYCNYEYLDENTIRIIFNRESYVPGLNANIKINVKRSEGASGNFVYNNNFRTSMKSDKYDNYNGMYILVYPLLDGTSAGGKDKKSISDLKKIIPREASSRGAIINTTDLQNFFNSINDNSCKLYFSKKRDNPLERLYYAHMLMKKNNNVYPTNTISLKLQQNDFKGYNGNNNLSLTPGTVFYYYNHGSEANNDYATLVPPEYLDSDEERLYHTTMNADGNEVRVFEYISPFLITIDDDLISSYLLTIMQDTKTFIFDSININSSLQFVATNMNWSRKFIYQDEDGKDHVYDNKYEMTVSMVQNNNNDYGLIKYHLDDQNKLIYDDIRVRMIMVLYSDETATNPYRYIEAKLNDYDHINYVYEFKFVLETDDLMDLNNRINIKGIYNAKPEEFQKKAVIDSGNAHGYLNNNTYAKIFILADFGTKAGDIKDGIKVTEDTAEVILYPESGNTGAGNRAEIEALLPLREDIVNKFLKNEIYIEKDKKTLNVATIIKSNPEYIKIVKNYNNDEQETEAAILKYLRNNEDSDFVQNVLLKDPAVNEVIDSYHYEDLSRYTLCNVMVIEDGIDFYYDYSGMMTSVVNVEQIQKKDANGNPLYKAIKRTDSTGQNYTEYKPIYLVNKKGTYNYQYKINRIPVIKNGFLNTEEKMEDFIYDLEERRKYINECLYVLEDTFGIDLKFFNTFGPSKRFYYSIPDATSYKVKVIIDELNVYSNTSDEDDTSNIVGTIDFGDEVLITKIKGQWGKIITPFEGWIKLSSTTRLVNYIDNVGLNMRFALEALTSADKYITTNIINDVKEYIEDINTVNELHIPNIITLITNHYREQLVYFEFLDVNGYGPACQHLYLDETKSVDVCPEFLNIAMTDDDKEEPQITIAVY